MSAIKALLIHFSRTKQLASQSYLVDGNFMARRIAKEMDDDGRVPPLVVQIADRLERDIISGHYRRGEWLREQDIADRLGTSRGPVREALRLAEVDGLVEMVPWRGARVVDMSPAEIDDLMEVVAALQGLVTRLAAVHGTDTDFDRIEEMVNEMEMTITGDRSMAKQLRLAFDGGALLREICGSDRAGSMLMRVGRLAYWQHRYLLGADKHWRRNAVRKWRRLVAALRARNAELADRAARDMVHHSKSYIMLTLARGTGDDRRPDDLPARMHSIGGR